MKTVKLVVVVVIAIVATTGAFVLGVKFSEPVKAFAAATQPAQHDHDDSDATHWYTCGMHPWIVLPQPGQCPICHMDLTPLDPAKFTGEIAIDPVVVQNIGVRVAPVSFGPLERNIRTVGNVTYDERTVRGVNIKVEGWIEKVHVGYEGAQVNRGDALFEYYSPRLYAAQDEFLLANRSANATSQRMLEAARTKLKFLDISDEQIAALQASGKPAKTMTVRSPHTGIVIAKHANDGMRVDLGMEVYRIADLSNVWVMATLYEYQLPYVEVGQTALMELPFLPGQRFEGKVIYIYPYLEEKTRQVKVRLEFANPDGLLKPGMFANVQLRSQLRREAVLAPTEAVIDTGRRKVAFVSLGEGRFEPRNVMTGIETDDGRIEVLDGLKVGEKVVVSSQFLLDSESRMREALAKMMRGDLASEQEAVVVTSGRSVLTTLPAPVEQRLGAALGAYFAIGDLLAADTTDGLAAPASKLAEQVDALIGEPIEGHEHFWHEHEEAATVLGKARELMSQTDLSAARETFGDLSIALRKLVTATGVPPSLGREVQALRCPMYRAGQGGAVWLQPAGDVTNPFMGRRMLECYDTREALPVTGAKAKP